MRRELAILLFFCAGALAASPEAEDKPYDAHALYPPGPFVKRPEKTPLPLVDFSKTPWALTPRDACGLFSTVLAYTQLRNPASGMCNLDEIKQTCVRIHEVMGNLTTSNPAERKTLAEKVPRILDKTYKCLEAINDETFKDFFKSREQLLEKKKVLLENACQTISDFSKTSNNSPDGTPDRLVDYDNPCRAMREFNESRIDACWSSGGELCKIAMGKVELENIVPSAIYEASFSDSVMPGKLNDYLAGAIDGAINVAKDRGADKLNDYVTKKVVAKAGFAGTVALATITAAAKQINEAATTGTNPWAHCVGSDQLGACLYNLFAGGIPESHPIDLPQKRGDHFERRCCRCTLDMFEDDATFTGDTKISSQPYFGPIEGGDFNKSFCKAWEGTRQNKALLFSKAGNQVYFVPRDCRGVTVRGKVCQPPPPATPNRRLEVIQDPKGAPGPVDFPTVRRSEPAKAEPPPPGVTPSTPSTASPPTGTPDTTYDEIFDETPPVSKSAPTEPPAREVTETASPSASGLPSFPRPPATESEPTAKVAPPAPTLVDGCSCGIESSVPTLSNYGTYLRFYLCVMRLNGKEVTRTMASSADPTCAQQCANLRVWEPASRACRVPASQTTTPTPTPASPDQPSANEGPRLLTPTNPPAVANAGSECRCGSEWSQITNGLHWKLCVVRRNGREIAWGYDYYNNCASLCTAMTQLSSVAPQCR